MRCRGAEAARQCGQLLSGSRVRSGSFDGYAAGAHALEVAPVPTPREYLSVDLTGDGFGLDAVAVLFTQPWSDVSDYMVDVAPRGVISYVGSQHLVSL